MVSGDDSHLFSKCHPSLNCTLSLTEFYVEEQRKPLIITGIASELQTTKIPIAVPSSSGTGATFSVPEVNLLSHYFQENRKKGEKDIIKIFFSKVRPKIV